MADPAFVFLPPENNALTKAQVTARYNTLVLKATNFPADSPTRRSIARAVLSKYPITEHGGSAARLAPPNDIKTTMVSLLPPPAGNFTLQYFNEALALIILLQQIRTFYCF